jgi:hypothetical protein
MSNRYGMANRLIRKLRLKHTVAAETGDMSCMVSVHAKLLKDHDAPLVYITHQYAMLLCTDL